MHGSTVHRRRILAAIESHAAKGAVFVVGPGGAGKTALANQVDAHARSTVGYPAPASGSCEPARGEHDCLVRIIDALRTVPAASAGAVSRDPDNAHDPPAGTNKRFVIDGIDQLSGGEASDLADALMIGSAHTQVVLAGRSVPEQLRAVAAVPTTLVFDYGDLYFDRDEIVASAQTHGILETDELVDSVVRITGGWPAAVDRLLALAAEVARPERLLSMFDSDLASFTQLCDSYTAHLTPDDVDALSALCVLDRFDESLVELAGHPDLLDRLRLAGAPITASSGWLTLPGLLHRVHRHRHIESVRVGRACDKVALSPKMQAHLADRGEGLTVLQAFGDSGDLPGAVSFFETLTPSQLAAIDSDDLGVTLMLMAPAMRDRPRALLMQARLALRSGNPGLVSEPLKTALASLAITDPDMTTDLHREVTAEMAFLQYQVGDVEESERLLELASRSTDEGSPPVRARILDTRAGLLALEPDEGRIAEAVSLLTESIALWRSLGDHARAGASTRILAVGVLLDLGRYSDAITLFESQLRSGNCSVVDRICAYAHLGRAFLFVGRPIDAERSLEAADQLATALGLVGLRGLVAWNQALATSLGDDPQTFAEAVVEAQGLLGPAMSTITGSAFAREMAEGYARFGLESKAHELVELARQNGGDELELLRCIASVEARAGDPSAALVILKELEDEKFPAGRRWTLPTYSAIAHIRMGADVEAADELDRAVRLASALGEPALPLVTEAKWFTSAPTALSPAVVEETHSLEISTLGGFSVQSHGLPLQVSTGRPGVLLQYLALNGSMASLDQVIDVLWDDIDLTTGKNRLRNVLQRARAVCGDAIDRRGDLLKLAPWVGVDLVRGLAFGRQVLAVDEPPLDSLDEALRLLAQPVLPERQYDEWVVRAQREIDQLRLRLIDKKVEICVADQQIDAAVAALEDGIKIDPYDLDRVQAAADKLIDLGRSSSAHSLRSLSQPV